MRWFKEETNIFNNGVDASLALFIQIGISIYSCIVVMNSSESGFNVYAMPLMTISFSAGYDTYGRYSKRKLITDDIDRNVYITKLILRLAVHAIAVFITLLFTGDQSMFGIRWIPIVFLGISGALIAVDMIRGFYLAWKRNFGVKRDAKSS